MLTDDLRDRVCLEPPQTDGVIAAGPITHQPHSHPYRVVLVDRGDQFVVWDQFFTLGTGVETVDQLKSYDDGDFSNGDYFPATALAEATERFGKRVAEKAHHIRSIYREGE